jgi:periplasmic copper chaperone A
MKALFFSAARGAAFAFLAAALTPTSAGAHDFDADKVELSVLHPWARPTPPNASAGAVYFHIDNRDAADKLIAARCSCANSAEFHESRVDSKGMSTMRQLSGVDLAAKQRTKFEPAGLHVMLMGLQKPLVKGDRFPLELEFARAGKITVEVYVENGPASMPPDASHEHHDHHELHEHQEKQDEAHKHHEHH